MNESLRAELLAMKERDVLTRQDLVDKGELDEKDYHPVMKSVHEENNKRIMEIINTFGWPLESEVGKDGAEAAWLVVQHAVLEPQFQAECIGLLKEAIEKSEAKAYYLAYLQDRVLVQQGKPQVYGTQHEIKEGKMTPLPTADPENTNKRRAALGLWLQEEHTAHLQKDYDRNQKNKAKQNGEQT